MKKGYWVSQVFKIKDQELFQKYFDATAPLVERGDFKFICGGPVQATLEGDSMIFGAVLEFKSLEEAKNYYNTEDYQKALSVLGDDVKEVIERNISVFEGM